jgi:hypothetical protein
MVRSTGGGESAVEQLGLEDLEQQALHGYERGWHQGPTVRGRDLGASLGKARQPRFVTWFPFMRRKQRSKNSLDDFEGRGFVRAVNVRSTTSTTADSTALSSTA